MDPYNPYSPPAVSVDTIGFETMRLAYRPAQGMGTKWMYLGVSLAQFVVSLGAGLTDDSKLKALFALVQLPLALTSLVLIGMWIYTAWSDIPADERGDITPGSAVGKLFIPFYNVYWIFAISTSLCDALNFKLVRIGSQPLAPKGLAVLGCIFHLLTSTTNIPGLEAAGSFIAVISYGLWFAYMFECDKARTILARNTYEERND